MPIRDENAGEAVPRHAFRNIRHEIEQMLHLDINRAREIHVMGLISVRDQGQQEHLPVQLLRRGLTYRPD